MNISKKTGEGTIGLDIFISIEEQLMLGLDMYPILAELKNIKDKNKRNGHANKSIINARTRVDEASFVMAAEFIKRFVLVMDVKKTRGDLYGTKESEEVTEE